MNITAWRDWLRTDGGMAAALFVALSSIMFATITGVTSSNDGSHYAAVRAIVETGAFEINPFWDYTEHVDYAFVGERKFSDRPPATALAASITYGLGQVLPPAIVTIPSKHDAENARMIYAVMAAALMMAGAVALFFLSLRRHFGVSAAGALLASLALGLGTAYWKYGSLLYSHATAAFLTWVALFLIFEAERDMRPRWFHALGIGLALAASTLAEYTHAIFAMIATLYGAAVFGKTFVDGIKSSERGVWWGRLVALAGGIAIPLIFLLIYNTINFGGPFELSAYHVNTDIWPMDQSLLTQFTTTISVGLVALTVYGSDNQGLFLLSPIALAGLPGLLILFRRFRRRGVMMIGAFVAFLLLVSTYSTFNPLTNDSRYLTPYLGLWFMPAALWLDERVAGLKLDTPRAMLWALLIFGLVWLSIRNQFMVIAFSWNHDLDLAQLKPGAIPLENVTLLLGTVFRDTLNLPLLWLVEALGAAAIFGVRALLRRFARKESNT